MASASVAIVIWVICGFAGFAIGRAKGRAALGAVLGIVLGVIGLIIIALIPARRPGSTLPPGPGYGGAPSGYGGPGYGTPGYGPPSYAPSPGASRDPWSAIADPPGHGGPGPVPVAPEPEAVPAQWAPDPTGRHEQRWWDGRGRTADVSDQGVTSQDPTY